VQCSGWVISRFDERGRAPLQPGPLQTPGTPKQPPACPWCAPCLKVLKPHRRSVPVSECAPNYVSPSTPGSGKLTHVPEASKPVSTSPLRLRATRDTARDFVQIDLQSVEPNLLLTTIDMPGRLKSLRKYAANGDSARMRPRHAVSFIRLRTASKLVQCACSGQLDNDFVHHPPVAGGSPPPPRSGVVSKPVLRPRNTAYGSAGAMPENPF